jgi:predicted aspartyl protease
MTGTVDSLGRALLRVRLQHPQSASVVEMDAWIDTGFTGELVIPQQQIAALGLPLGLEEMHSNDLADTLKSNPVPCLPWYGH